MAADWPALDDCPHPAALTSAQHKLEPVQLELPVLQRRDLIRNAQLCSSSCPSCNKTI